MREYLSVDREANAIRLQREIFSGTFLLVEGSTDKIFYERFVDNVVRVLPSNSAKLGVIEVLSILGKSNFQGVLGIVDADFDHLNASSYSTSNLIYTDTHDLETMLLYSSALEKVVAEFGSEEKIAKFDRDIRTALLEAGIVIGYLRWIFQTDELNLTFNEITFSKFIDPKTVRIDELKLIQEVKNKSKAFELKSEDLQYRLMNQKSDSHDPWQVCCGHDLVEILSLGLRKAIGSANATDVEPNILERSLRLAYEKTYFYTTQMYLSIRSWESNNQPFTVFGNDEV